MPLMIGTWKPRMRRSRRDRGRVKIGGSGEPGHGSRMGEWIGNDRSGSSSRRHRPSTRTAMLPATARVGGRDVSEVVGDLDPTATGSAAREFCFAGTPEEVAAHARELFDAA